MIYVILQQGHIIIGSVDHSWIWVLFGGCLLLTMSLLSRKTPLILVLMAEKPTQKVSSGKRRRHEQQTAAIENITKFKHFYLYETCDDGISLEDNNTSILLKPCDNQCESINLPLKKSFYLF